MSHHYLSPGQQGSEILIEWWETLDDNRGVRATLRRCQNPTDVIFQPSYMRLHDQLSAGLQRDYVWEIRLARVIGLLAHCRDDQAELKMARAMAGNPPIVSELRFRRLLQTTPEDLYLPMIRALRLLDQGANLSDLIESVYHWNDSVRKRWAFDYYPNTPEKSAA